MSYDILQTTFLMAMAADDASGIAATEVELQGYLAAALNGGTDPIGTGFGGFFPLTNPQLAGGDWAVVWGPCVHSLSPTAADYVTNAMFVAYSAALATYVVAVAGTDPQSLYDWIQEDGDVAALAMAKWPFALPFLRTIHLPWGSTPPAAVSAATALGVSNLLTEMVDPVNGTLQSFLTHKASATSTLIFTGHSLAGALAPTLALYLYPQPQSSGWNQVLVLAMAGASPGNGAFAGVFTAAGAYPPVASGIAAPYGNWNVDYANQHDLVPHAWNQVGAVISAPNAAGNYPSIYGVMAPVLGMDVTSMVDAAAALALGGDHMNLTQTLFAPDWGSWVWTQNADGSWQYPPVWTPLPAYTDASPMTTLDAFGAVLEAAHVDQYYNFFGVVPPQRMPISLPTGGFQADMQRALRAAAKISV